MKQKVRGMKHINISTCSYTEVTQELPELSVVALFYKNNLGNVPTLNNCECEAYLLISQHFIWTHYIVTYGVILMFLLDIM